MMVGGAFHIRRERRGDLHCAHSRSRPLVFSQRHCARYRDVLEPGARRLLRGRYFADLGTTAVRRGLAAAAMAGGRAYGTGFHRRSHFFTFLDRRYLPPPREPLTYRHRQRGDWSAVR